MHWSHNCQNIVTSSDIEHLQYVGQAGLVTFVQGQKQSFQFRC
jgi:hypothetical protein